MIFTRLTNQRTYLAGAMDRVQDRGATWRESITPFLDSLGIVVFNPITKPTNIGLEDEDTHAVKSKLKSQRRYDELSSMMKIIRSVDLRLVDISDFVIVNLDLDVHPCGTLEEIFSSNNYNDEKYANYENNLNVYKNFTIPSLFSAVCQAPL